MKEDPVPSQQLPIWGLCLEMGACGCLRDFPLQVESLRNPEGIFPKEFPLCLHKCQGRERKGREAPLVGKC